MSLLFTILILLVLAGYGMVKAIQPQNPPIENMEEHLKIIQSLPNPKARQKYLRDIMK
jgi:Na+-transporting methylmalonyl-CoA/oxaloacetate decarboxylase gamma subunit